MRAIAQIVEMDQERDRKTCLSLDLKITGANRDLAQWLLDHPRYQNTAVADWLGCGETRIRGLRKWAAAGFTKESHPTAARRQYKDSRRAAKEPLETNDNSESDDEFDPETGEVDVAPPEVVEDNVLHAIGSISANVRLFKKVLKISALDREAATRISTALERVIGKMRSVLSILEKKG